MATEGTSQPNQELIAEIKAVVTRAKAGDQTALPLLRGYLDRHPELWRRCGDVAAQAEGAWIALAAGPNLHLRECMTRFAAARRAELTRPGALPAEKMLVDRAVTCALQVEYFSAMEANAIDGKEPVKLLQWRARRHAQAQRAFQAALSALLTVQKLFPAEAAKMARSLPATEAEPVAVPIPETTPASLPVEVEDHPEDAAYQSTGWTAAGDPPAVSHLLSVRN